MKDPVDHIERPLLPWRSPHEAKVTECGLNADKVTCLTRTAFVEQLKECGRQRTSLTTCMTCLYTAERWATSDLDPGEAVAREIQWEAKCHRGGHGHRMRDELRAIALLIERHSDEFAQLVGGIGSAVDLKSERERRARERPLRPPTVWW